MRRQDPGQGRERRRAPAGDSGRGAQRAALWTGGSERGKLLLLGDDIPQAVRDACTDGLLVCPVDGCPNPAFSAVRRRGAVPHFRHGKGVAGHGDESAIHFQAKALIEAWARRCAPDAEVALERRSGTRRPDIQVRCDAAGWSTAIEYQRSELPVEVGEHSWVVRQDALAAMHKHVIWLLDPVLVENHPTSRYGVVGSDLMFAMARRGLPVRSLDPETRQVTSIVPWRQGTKLLDSMDIWGAYRGVTSRKHFMQFRHALDDCTLVDGRMETPTDRKLADLGLDHQLNPRHGPEPRDATQLPVAAPVPHEQRAVRPSRRGTTGTRRGRESGVVRGTGRPSTSTSRRTSASPRITTAAEPVQLPSPPRPLPPAPPPPPPPPPPVRTAPRTADEEPPPPVVEPSEPPSIGWSAGGRTPATVLTWAITLVALVVSAARVIGWW